MTIYVILATLLAAIVYFALTATGLALLFSPIIGVLAFFFFKLIEPERKGSGGYVRVMIAAGGGTAVGALLGYLLGVSQTPIGDWAGVGLAFVAGVAAFSIWARGSVTACVLCKAPAPPGAAFTCPRCSDWVCARPTCWNARYSRCSRCHERDVVIFPIREAWWAQQLGPRVMKGECASCFKDAQEADLRECGLCHWPMCKRCWDYHNGTCQRCNWIIPNPPSALRPFLRRAKSSGRGHAARPGVRGAAAPPGRDDPPDTDETTIAAPDRPVKPRVRRPN